tara:strand:- start:4134 stop:5672 length:1539 start_codon:yes stop_codon:yes gene_type:complete
MWIYRLNAVDDSYIFYRYGRSLVEGFGLTFNPGQYVEGYTSPLWVFVSACVHLFPLQDPHPLMQLIGGWCALVSVYLMYAVGRVLFREQYASWSLLPPLLLLSSPGWASYAMSGMETSLYVCLLSGALLSLLQRGVGWRFGAWMGIAALCRPETPYVLGMMLLLGWAWTYKRGEENAPTWSWTGALVSIAIVSAAWGGWIIFRFAYYGEWLPNTYFAKSLPFGLGIRLGLGYAIRYMYATYFFSLICLGLLLLLRRWRLCMLGLCWLLCCLPTVRLGGDWMPFHRFFLHYAPFEVALWSVTLWALYDTLKLEQFIKPVVLVTGILVLLPSTHILPTFERAEDINDNGVAIRTLYRSIGTFLRTQPNTRKVAVLDCGAIPYFARVPVIDLAGLTDATIGKAPGIFHKKQYDPMYVLSQKPDWILLHTHGPTMPTKPQSTMNVRLPGGKTLVLKLNGKPFLPPHLMFATERILYLHPHFQSSYTHAKSVVIRRAGQRTTYAQHLFRRNSRRSPR